jgi:hypothetical protein
MFQGRLGNLMCQYGTLLAHANRLGARPVLSNDMKKKMLKHFPNIQMPSESEIPECNFNWHNLEISKVNNLDPVDIKVHFLNELRFQDLFVYN